MLILPHVMDALRANLGSVASLAYRVEPLRMLEFAFAGGAMLRPVEELVAKASSAVARTARVAHYVPFCPEHISATGVASFRTRSVVQPTSVASNVSAVETMRNFAIDSRPASS